MANNLEADVVVVGSGTSGSYLAWRLAQVGVRVLVLEKQCLADGGQAIDIFHMDEVRFDQFGLPHPEGEELLGHHPTGLAWSPDLQVQNRVRYAFYVMHKPAFHRRLQRYVLEAGAEFLEETDVVEPLIEDSFVVGVRARQRGAPLEVRASVVVDASGIDGVVRTRLPGGLGVETDPIRDGDTLFVCLEFREDLPPGTPRGLNFYPYHKAFWNPSRGEGAILGIGQPGSYQFAWQKHQEWREDYFGDPGRVVKRTQGRTPYRRSPYSLVADGFLVVGDAAFQTKPFSGEGVTSSFTACQIAAEVLAEALRRGDVSRASLWPYNVRYFRDQGAKFASMFVQLPAAAELSRAEVDYLFHQDLIFGSSDFEQMNMDYATEMDLAKTLALGAKLLWGVASRRFSRASLGRLLEVSSRAARIRERYEAYPESPDGLEAWVAAVRPLWEPGGHAQAG
jgi:digeranylgeranylglycerophospholipid reductase